MTEGITPMASDHIVKSFDDELKQLESTLVQMAGLVESNLNDSLSALARRDNVLAQAVMAADRRIDELNADIDARVVRLLALRQPMAGDLRMTVAALRIASDLERIGDYAANLSKRTLAINQAPMVPSAAGVGQLGKLVVGALNEVIDAFVERDPEKAMRAWARDQEADEMYTALFRQLLTYMMEDPRNITACTHILFMAKNVERVGDHATNIAETVYFMITGQHLPNGRPKADTSSYTVMDNGAASSGDGETPTP